MACFFSIEGPCGGKTTGQARLCSFFETLGWKVLRVPETATVLLGGGIKFSELNAKQGVKFQEELLRTMIQIENTFFSVAEAMDRNVLVICDRGTMDASAFISPEEWEDILQRNQWNDVELRDSRYNQVIQMVSAANGAEKFYTTEDHSCRSEGLDQALELDRRAAGAWVGHPYFDMIDNSTDFETKLNRMILSVCVKLGIDVRDRLQNNARKSKFLVRGPVPEFPVKYRDFTVVHNYLRSSGYSSGKTCQARLRKRGHKNHWSYTHTIRRPVHGQSVEVKTILTARDYAIMLTQSDMNHMPVYKTRRCFLYGDQYFQMDVYKEPLHPRCQGLILLETYSTLSSEELYQRLPGFLTIVKEVTGDPRYSMFNLSLKEGWKNNQHFSNLISSPAPLPLAEDGALVSNGEGVNGGDENKKRPLSPREERRNGKGEERNESFLACCDETSMKHHILAEGFKGLINDGSCEGNGLNGGHKGSGKYKGYEGVGAKEENGHTNGSGGLVKNGQNIQQKLIAASNGNGNVGTAAVNGNGTSASGGGSIGH